MFAWTNQCVPLPLKADLAQQVLIHQPLHLLQLLQLHLGLCLVLHHQALRSHPCFTFKCGMVERKCCLLVLSCDLLL
jgi:hypothetical protein